MTILLRNSAAKVILFFELTKFFGKKVTFLSDFLSLTRI